MKKRIKNKTRNKSPAKAQVTRIILPMTSSSEEIMQKPKHKLKKPPTIKKVIKPDTFIIINRIIINIKWWWNKTRKTQGDYQSQNKNKNNKPAETTIKLTNEASKPETIKLSKTAAVTNIITMPNTQITIEPLKSNKQNVASWFKMYERMTAEWDER
jgi:hypothetical protein